MYVHKEWKKTCETRRFPCKRLWERGLQAQLFCDFCDFYPQNLRLFLSDASFLPIFGQKESPSRLGEGLESTEVTRWPGQASCCAPLRSVYWLRERESNPIFTGYEPVVILEGFASLRYPFHSLTATKVMLFPYPTKLFCSLLLLCLTLLAL